MNCHLSAPSGGELLANLEGLIKKFRVTKENEKEEEIFTLANLDNGCIRKFIVKKVDESAFLASIHNNKGFKEESNSLTDENENTAVLEGGEDHCDGQPLVPRAENKKNDKKSESLTNGKLKNIDSRKPARFKLGCDDDSDDSMPSEDKEDKDDPGVVNPTFFSDDDEDGCRGDESTASVSTRSSPDQSPSHSPRLSVRSEMSPQPSPRHSPVSHRSGNYSQRSSVSSVRKGILKKSGSSSTINMEMVNLGLQQNATINAAVNAAANAVAINGYHRARFSDPYDECFVPVDTHRFVSTPDDSTGMTQKSLGGHRVKFILETGKPDHVTGSYDDIRIEKMERERVERIERGKNLEVTNTSGDKGGRKCLLFCAAMLVLTASVITAGLYGSGKLKRITLLGQSGIGGEGASSLSGGKPNVPPGGVTSPTVVSYRPNILEVQFKIVNQKFTESLKNIESNDFKNLANDLQQVLEEVLFSTEVTHNGKAHLNLKIIEFESGSIVCTFRIAWQFYGELKFEANLVPPLNETMVKKRFENAINAGNKLLKQVYEVPYNLITVEKVVDKCNKKVKYCSHGCEFSDETLRFSCTCPDDLTLKKKTKCVDVDNQKELTDIVSNVLLDKQAVLVGIVTLEDVPEKEVPEITADSKDPDVVTTNGTSVDPGKAEHRPETNVTEVAVPEGGSANVTDPGLVGGGNDTMVPVEGTSNTTVDIGEGNVNTTLTDVQTEQVPETNVTEAIMPEGGSTNMTDPVLDGGVNDTMVPIEGTSNTTVSIGEGNVTTTLNSTTTISVASSTIPSVESSNATIPSVESSNATTTMNDTEVLTGPVDSMNTTTQTTVSLTDDPSITSTSTTEIDNTIVANATVNNENIPIMESNGTVVAQHPLMDVSNMFPEVFVSPGTRGETQLAFTNSSKLIPLYQDLSALRSGDSPGQGDVHSQEMDMPLLMHNNNSDGFPQINANDSSTVVTENGENVESASNHTLIDENVNLNVSIPEVQPSTTIAPIVEPTYITTTRKPVTMVIPEETGKSHEVHNEQKEEEATTSFSSEGTTVNVNETTTITSTDPEVKTAIVSQVPEIPCAEDQVECENGTSQLGRCIPRTARCNSFPDCSDRSDEIYCAENNCFDNFLCEDKECIERQYVCDGVSNCRNGDDEKNCELWQCREDEFACGGPEPSPCIPLSLQCDGNPDCFDHSDEINCSASCASDEFRCDEGWCIANARKCDGIIDCYGGEDEEDHCNCVGLDETKCEVGGCVPEFQLCDGLRQCPDGSDEWNCVRIGHNTTQLEVRSGGNRWLAVCGESWTYELSNLVCQQLGSVASSSTATRVSQGVQLPRVKWEPKSSANNITPLQFTLKAECSSDILAHLTCEERKCGNWTDTETKDGAQVERLWPSLALLLPTNPKNSSNVRAQSCTASILTPVWVLGAYSCLSAMENGLSVSSWSLETGRSTTNNGGFLFFDKIVQYPGLVRRGGLWSGDAVLLHLDKPMVLGETTKPICIPDDPPPTTANCVVAGWTRDTSILSQFEHRVPVPMLGLDDCNTSHYKGRLTNAHTCVGFNVDQHKPCHGDEGSPLMCMSESGLWRLEGVLSHYAQYGRAKHPSVFTALHALQPWLSNTIGIPSSDGSSKTKTTTTTTTTTTTATPTTTTEKPSPSTPPPPPPPPLNSEDIEDSRPQLSSPGKAPLSS